jgi:hypothetical protein
MLCMERLGGDFLSILFLQAVFEAHYLDHLGQPRRAPLI